MGRQYDWNVYGTYQEVTKRLDGGSAPSLDDALSAAHQRVADDIPRIIGEAQAELRRVIATDQQPSKLYRSRVEEALHTHEPASAHLQAGIEHLRQKAYEGVSAETLVNDDPLEYWWTPVYVRRSSAQTHSKSDSSVRQTVFQHVGWEYSILVDADG